MTLQAPAAALALLLIASGASALPPEQETEHVVEAGETLNGIANRAGVPSHAIAEANDLEAPYNIRAGQTLKIPREDRPARRSIASRTEPGNEPSLKSASSYVVKPRDTLGGIANRAGIPRILIAEANGLAPPFTLQAGQNLLLPRTRHHRVAAGDTGFGISYRYGVPWKDIAVANGLNEGDAIKEGQNLLIPTMLDIPEAAPDARIAATTASRFAWPVTGDIRRGFHPGGMETHDGLDIVAPRGTAVGAVDAGTVIFARKDSREFGNLVVIDHGGGWHSAYASLDRITVRKGHYVSKGERIGLVGDTSITGKTELHFELRRDGKAIDPLSQLPDTK